MIDLKPEYLKIVKKILAEYVPHRTVWVYGSRIKGTSHESSDLDLLILDDEQSHISEEKLFALREAFSNSNLPILVDVLAWSDIPEDFKKTIKNTHEVLI